MNCSVAELAGITSVVVLLHCYILLIQTTDVCAYYWDKEESTVWLPSVPCAYCGQGHSAALYHPD